MKDLTDFAVLCKGVTIPSKKDTLRVIPLPTAPSISDAIKGLSKGSYGSIVPADIDKNMPKNKAGAFIDNVVKVQHKSDGYCRIVAKLTYDKSNAQDVASAKGFVLIQKVKVEEQDTWKPIAVASLNAGIDLTQPEIYVAFTFSKTNNYQSVSFSPNAFATIEDINEINGLDGLHIAFDTASGDLKLLDKDGNVLDQANLPIKADVIIADGEEGYKYVKTDVKQDIHAAKAWMLEGKTAWKTVDKVPYTMQKAALVVAQISNPASRVFVESGGQTEHTISEEEVTIAHVTISGSTYMVADIQGEQCSLFKIKGDSEKGLYQGCTYSPDYVTLNADDSPTAEIPQYTITNSGVSVDVIKIDGNTYVLGEMESQTFQPLTLIGEVYENTGTIETREGSSTDRVLGITTDGTNLYTFDENAETPSKILNISGEKVRWLDTKPLTEVSNHTLKYGLEAFVWTVKGEGDVINEPFFQKLNASLLALGFHEGDDIALGTNLATLAPTEGGSPLNKVDADDYIHGKNNKATREQEVDAQRKLAKDELVAWNAQHPTLEHDGLNGTRISEKGLDVRNGKIEIGNGIANATGEQHKEDNVKRYVIETDIDVVGDGARTDKGLQIGVIDSLDENGDKPIQKDILTINAEDYISGAPTCLALLKCSKDQSDGRVSAGLGGGRITANFTAIGAEINGVFTLTITDNRANNGFGDVPRIVEIIPVYKSGADASEAVPAQRSISAIAKAEPDNKKRTTTLSIQCSQVIDWAQSIDLGGTVASTEGQGNPVSNGMELYLIVKVY